MALSRISWRIYGCILLGLLAAMHLAHGLLRLADPDEYQVLVNAADAARGLTPYVDFWDNHGPLSIWLLQPILKHWSGGHELISWMRGAMWLQTIALGAGIFWLTSRTMPKYLSAPWIAVSFLLAAPPFLSKSIELRGDNTANLLTTISLGCLAAGLITGRSSLFLAAGLAIGLIAGFTLKFIIIGAALAAFCAAWCWREKQRPRKSAVAYFAAGFCVPIFIIWLILRMDGSLDGFMACYFGGNVNRDAAGISTSSIVEMYKQAPGWTVWATIVIGYWTMQTIRKRAEGLETGLLAMVFVVLAQFILILPTKNLQSLLPLYTPLAMLGGGASARWIEHFRHNISSAPRWLLAGALVIPLLLARDLADYSNLKNKELPKEVRFANAVRDLTKNETYIFDPSGVVFLKARPGAFHVLVTFIRQMHQSGTIDLKIPQMLTEHDVRTIVFDDRTMDLRVSDVYYLMEHYSPVLKGRNCWLLNTDAASEGALPEEDAARWQEWLERIYDDATTPTQRVNPPDWYKTFLAQSK